MTPGRKTGIAVVVVTVALLGVAAYGLFALERPRVESVDNDWGAVTENRSEVETDIAVDNPALLRVVDGAANVEYAVALNGVTFARASERRVDLDGRDDVVTVRTWIDNDEVPDWWVTHVNRDERTTVRIDPRVELKYGGVDVPARPWTRERTVRTDLLAPLETNCTREFSAFDRTVLVVNETDARWGNATSERTPIEASATVTNSLPVPIPITDVNYTVRMNGIVVGQGEAGQRTTIPPESTRTLEADAHVDNSRLDEWWVSHLRNDSTTRMTVDFNATIEYGGVERRLPLEFISYERTFRTDLFVSENGSEASLRPVSREDGPRVGSRPRHSGGSSSPGAESGSERSRRPQLATTTAR